MDNRGPPSLYSGDNVRKSLTRSPVSRQSGNGGRTALTATSETRLDANGSCIIEFDALIRVVGETRVAINCNESRSPNHFFFCFENRRRRETDKERIFVKVLSGWSFGFVRGIKRFE